MLAAQTTARSPPGSCRLHRSSLARPPAARPFRAARRGVATGRTISDTLTIGFFDVCVRALTLFEEAAEVVERMVFEALFSVFRPAQSLVFSYPR